MGTFKFIILACAVAAIHGDSRTERKGVNRPNIKENGGRTIQMGSMGGMQLLTLPRPQQQPGTTYSVCPDTSVCAASGQCLLAGGVSVGRCGIMGIMVCCARREDVPQACSASNSLVTIKDKVSTISNSPDAKSCRFEVYKAADNICQLRLDMDTFELKRPLWREDCPDNSRLTISESVTVPNNFPLCGVHSQQKLYLAYGRSSRISLSFRTDLTSFYNIRLTQIECNSQDRIPDQCLQNHEAPFGTVKSFGFPQYMINNQKYTVCINSKAVSDTGSITWKECTSAEAQSNSSNNFILSEYFIDVPPKARSYDYYDYNELREALNETDRRVFLPAEGASCLKTSHIEIHGEEKHCGAKFLSSAAIRSELKSEARPYMLSVSVLRDSGLNLPDFAYYHINGLDRNTDRPGLPDPVIEPNDCNYVNETARGLALPATLGFEQCQIATRALGGPAGGKVDKDLCLCGKKLGKDLRGLPQPRDDLIERTGFCLKYSIA